MIDTRHRCGIDKCGKLKLFIFFISSHQVATLSLAAHSLAFEADLSLELTGAGLALPATF